ncbi:hypothetical protein BJ878DRAFT_544320 [Calycina marina]|uniref:Methyltransferase domain-containing protein n=1 Tax=Calycina marina TaxID=1763456 RepID=A0A9P7Z034_9HELO|nr:hypothetical protein BJ878DRAFT_544320 [Calycina marina]
MVDKKCNYFGGATDRVPQKRVELAPARSGAVVHDNGCGSGAVTKILIRHLDKSEGTATIVAADKNSDVFARTMRLNPAHERVQIITDEMCAKKLELGNDMSDNSFMNFIISYCIGA